MPSITHTLIFTWQRGTESISKTVNKVNEKEVNIDVTVNAGVVDLEVSINIDVSLVKSIYISTDQDVLLETNSGSTPDDTVSLVADIPLSWHDTNYLTNPFGTDVVSMFFTNSGGTSANVQIRTLTDSTP